MIIVPRPKHCFCYKQGMMYSILPNYSPLEYKEFICQMLMVLCPYALCCLEVTPPFKPKVLLIVTTPYPFYNSTPVPGHYEKHKLCRALSNLVGIFL